VEREDFAFRFSLEARAVGVGVARIAIVFAYGGEPIYGDQRWLQPS